MITLWATLSWFLYGTDAGRLGDTSWLVRERASAALLRTWPLSYPVLTDVTHSPDLEVRWRARCILARPRLLWVEFTAYRLLLGGGPWLEESDCPLLKDREILEAVVIAARRLKLCGPKEWPALQDQWGDVGFVNVMRMRHRGFAFP